MGSLKPDSEPKQELNDSGCVQDSSESYKGQAELLDLSDDVLLYILKRCSPRDLKALGHTCPRLGILICDRTLWQRVDARSGPTGQERLRWLLTHCLTPATQELKLTGYVNRDTRCLGIQDLTWPISGEPGASRSAPSVDVEHFLLRMWYSHLPRYAMSPRWPDKREAAGKAYSRAAEGAKPPLSPLSQLASEIVAGASSASTSNISDLSNSGPNSSNSGPNSSVSGPSSSSSCSNSNNDGANSSNSEPNSINSGPNSGESEVISGETKHEMDEIVSNCHGPQFTLNHNLLKSLRSKCQNLSSLALEYCNLDYRNANIRYFPPNLKKLSLKGTRCYNLPLNTSYLGKIQDRLSELEYLDISECEWFEPASLMPLSKVKNLQELYMKDCRRLTECVAYASLATRYGFQKLRILDVRGSPVADSEVSAFGWLPLLEELYVSPPDDFKTCSEHSHKWDDVLAPFTELDSWESEEPDYYKCKSTPVEFMDEDEDLKEDGEGVSEVRLGDVMLGNYITCASLERRIIVIHPNRQNQNENRENDQPARPAADPVPPAAEPEPAANPTQDPGLQPGPSRNLKRPYPCKVLNLAKKRFNEEANTSEDDQERSDERPIDSEPMNYTPNPESSSSKPSTSESSSMTIPDSGSTSASESTSKSSDIDPEPSNSRTDNSGSSTQGQSASSSFRIGNQTPRINVDLGSNPSPESSRRRLSPKRRYPDPRENPDHVPPYFARYFNRIANAMSENARPPLAVHARPIHDRPSIDGGRSIDAYIWDCPDMPRRGCIPRQVAQAQRARRIDINIQRANLPLPREFQHLGYHLVSDSAVLRFGRAENDNINYIHIGHNFHANDPGVRPDRSNLRVLSITGYRNITDRSLEHLATAAPYIQQINFSYSSVTERGVEVFKAIRPNCEVTFSKFYRDV